MTIDERSVTRRLLGIRMVDENLGQIFGDHRANEGIITDWRMRPKDLEIHHPARNTERPKA
ncbi:hypothetical protein [Thioalkalivibrio sp. HK1]|uniref:hypothetical protein n=1 Tax=Thioalkalivibrio sp. HK1 TaxID=1469245 RepID=UPI0004703F22|nr:hypothetical protein [Thioalkalivibrio sp. HK1]